ncbi:MAG: metallophosphoesterase [Acidobacteriota bacterium]
MALHRFIHIGDTHLKGDRRQVDRVAALEQIVAHVQRRAEDDTLAAIIWPGDLYDAKSTVDDRNLLTSYVQAFAAAATVLVCYGNHDQPGDLAVLERLQGVHRIRVVDTPGVVTFETALGVPVSAFVLPYPHKGGLVAAGVDHQALGQDAASLLDPIFMTAAAALEPLIAAGHIPLMATHINIGGSVSSVGQPQIGQEIELNPALLARLPMSVAVLANHIHKHQQVGRLVYAGSIARMDFGEQEAKGFVEWTWDDEARAWSWEFILLDTPGQFHIEGRLTRDAFTIDTVNGEHVSPGPGDDGLVLPGDDFKGGDVRCRYHFVKAEIGALDVAKIHAEFAGCRTLVLEPIAEQAHSVRAPEIAAAVTLDEKVHAYAARQGIAVTPGFDAKLALIQSSPDDAVQALVATQLASIGQRRDTSAVQQLQAQTQELEVRA